MRERVCNNCGGREYKLVGQNMVKCKFCGTLYVDEHGSKEEEVLIVGAYEILREFDFEKAEKEFDKILTLFPFSFEGYFGRALAKCNIVVYNNSRGIKTRPCFFGKICNLEEQEDYKKALELAPEETKKTYSEMATRINKIYTQYAEKVADKQFDVIVCGASEEEQTFLKQNLDLEIYFPPQKPREEFTYRALETAKAMLFYLDESQDFSQKLLIERYRYLTKRGLKAMSSFIIVKDNSQKLTKDFSFCKSVIDKNSISFLQDLQTMLKNEMKKTLMQSAKIESVAVERKKPSKKEYVKVDSVSPKDLGSYNVENLELKESTKIKWIFLALKNGDFATAENLIAEELENNPYNSEVLFANAMAKRNIKSQEEFFKSISNFNSREEIENILRYSNKEFAEFFVDSFENLIIKLDDKDYYNLYILFLASYNSPNRENFIGCAANKAAETMDKDLIEKVERCLDKNDVDKFIEFYNLLAQKDSSYYNKILELDAGHTQSNFAVLYSHFSSTEDLLNYQNKQEIEDVFQYLEEEKRAQFVSSIVSQILKVAFINLQKAESQIDFYCAYLSDEYLKQILKEIYQTFMQQGFFKQAEKYLAILISKEKTGENYWDLIKIKAHCKSDSEVILSDVKVTSMPEWFTLLEISSEDESSRYAEIASKSNLYEGKKKKFQEDMLDRDSVIEKIGEFISRNDKILLEIEKQDGFSAIKGVEYYKLQLQPFKKYIEKFKKIESFEEYQNLYDKLCDRLSALDLNLDSSISAIKVEEKNGGMKNYKIATETKEKHEKTVKNIKKGMFLKRFCFIFIELLPLAFSTFLFLLSLFLPKEVYLYFNQDFLIFLMAFGVVVAFGNLLYFESKKKKIFKKTKFALILLSSLGFINLVLFGFTISFLAPEITLGQSDDMHTLLANAKYGNFKLIEDIDLEEKTWRGIDFMGSFDGDGHSIINIKLSKNGFFKNNLGEVENVNFSFTEQTFKNLTTFGAVATTNGGKIKNVVVNGSFEFECDKNAVLGGIVGEDNGGEISGCENNLDMQIQTTKSISAGSLIGKVAQGNKKLNLIKNKNTANINIIAEKANKIIIGGIVGTFEDRESAFSQNEGAGEITVSGKAEFCQIGGLAGLCYVKSDNNLSRGVIDARELDCEGYLGGLFGETVIFDDELSYSYSIAQVLGPQKKGSLVGKLSGKITNSFGLFKLFGEQASTFDGEVDSYVLAEDEFYRGELDFDTKIWDVSNNQFPQLRYE